MAEKDRGEWTRPVFVIEGRTIGVGDVILAAHCRGELQPAWARLLLLLEYEKQGADLPDADEDGPDEEGPQAISEQFRYERELITAEETERWLADRGLTLEDFNAFVLRHHWADTLDEPAGTEALDYRSAPDELWELFRVELLLSGEFDRMAVQLSWRMAAAHSQRGQPAPDRPEPESADPDSDDEADEPLQDWAGRLGCDPQALGISELEAAYQRECDRLLAPKNLEHTLGLLRLPLTQLDLEIIDLESLDTVREALLCVRDDGASMSEVAADGRYPYLRTTRVLEDLPAELQQKLMSAAPGDVLDPLPREDGFQLFRLLGRAEPELADDQVRERVERQILERHFAELTASCIQWLLRSNGTS